MTDIHNAEISPVTLLSSDSTTDALPAILKIDQISVVVVSVVFLNIPENCRFLELFSLQ